MKKTVLILLTGVLLLSAVEWDIEQVTTGDQYWNDWPMIAVDNSGAVGIVYDEPAWEYYALMFATNQTGSWVSKEIIHDYDGGTSFDFDSKGNAWVVLSNADLYLATDTSGEFEITQLTHGLTDIGYPVLRIDNEDKIHIAFPEYTEFDYDLIHYGWADHEGFHSEVVTDEYGGGFDLVIDHNNNPHVFFANWIGETGNLWHAYLSPLNQNPTWDAENIYNAGSFFPSDPNATIDSEGTFHVAFNVIGTNYITNQSGDWVVDTTLGAGGEFPVIAVDPKNNPYIAYLWYDGISETMSINLLSKSVEGWSEEDVYVSDMDELTADDRRFFVVDADGYGHITYAEWSYSELEEDDTGYVYHAKTTEPLTDVRVVESPPQLNSLSLEVRGSTVHFSLPEQGSISVNLYDACGRRVQSLASGTFTAGEHAVPINTTDLSSGVYFVRAEIAERSANAKFVLMR